MEVQLFDRADWVPIPARDESIQHAEDVVHHLCKNRINCRPTTLTLFALYSMRTKTYVPPQHKIHTGPHAQEKYQLRLRYKLPLSSKLQTLDKQAFLYYYHQVLAFDRTYQCACMCSNVCCHRHSYYETVPCMGSILTAYVHWYIIIELVCFLVSDSP